MRHLNRAFSFRNPSYSHIERDSFMTNGPSIPTDFPLAKTLKSRLRSGQVRSQTSPPIYHNHSCLTLPPIYHNRSCLTLPPTLTCPSSFLFSWPARDACALSFCFDQMFLGTGRVPRNSLIRGLLHIYNPYSPGQRFSRTRRSTERG